jgi:GxxExxY protein
MTENDISYKIRGAIFNVYQTLGPGLLESAYEATLIYELKSKGLDVLSQVSLPIIYNDVDLEVGYRIDILVNRKVIIELKSVDQIHPVHHKQVLTYLKLSGMKLGILVNFNTDNINDSIFRKVNNLD